MKTMKIGATVLLLALSIGLIAWTTTNPMLTGSGNTASQDFVISNVTLRDNSNLTDPLPRYEVFFFTGDGNYMLEPMAADVSITNPTLPYNYVYPAAGTYQPYVETTDVYDDDENPPGVYRMAPLTVNNGSNTPYPNKNLGGKPVIITPVRKMVHGDSLTYIVTYENPLQNETGCDSINGHIEFTFDKDKITYQGFSYYIGSHSPVDNTNATTGIINIPFIKLAKGKQKNAFLNFKTSGRDQAVVTPPTAKMVLDKEFACSFVNTEAFVLSDHCSIVSSHDPNHKTAWLETRNNQRYLVYKIDFQNDGPAIAKNITITDELDVKLKSCSLSAGNISAFPYRGTVVPTFLSNGVIKVELKDIDLNGLNEPKYGIDFFEPQTKGYIKIEIPVTATCPGQLLPCDAILNRASIRFDCNPPIETNLEILNADCFGNLPFPPSSSSAMSAINVYAACTDSVLSDTFIVVPASATNVPLLDAYWTTLLSPANGFHCQWYPESGLTGANSANATANTVRNMTYTLVASKNCVRYIIHRTIQVPCNLAITEAISGPNTKGNYDLTLTASGSNNTLQWQDCSTVNPVNIQNLVPGKYYFSVYDESTGCSAEKWVTLCGNEPTVTDTPGDCVANLQVSGGQAPYTFRWQWNGMVQSFTGTNTNLAWKNNVSVTVTDANGCSTVFSPVKGSCSWVTDWSWWIFGGVLGAAIAVFSYFRMKRRR